MKVIEILTAEHRVIEQVLSALETGAWLLSLEESFRPGFFVEAAEFLQGYADGCHHRKEEEILFKALVENGMPERGSPVAAMLHEHEVARAYTHALNTAAIRLKAGDHAAFPEIISNARHYAALLHHHIHMENQMVFPLADRLIPPEQHEALWQACVHVDQEEIGEGIYEKYLALAKTLELEMFGVEENPDFLSQVFYRADI